MQRRCLGRSTFGVPAIGMGTWRTFDTDDERRPIVDEAIAVGIDLFDSSPMYGKSEATLAVALAERRSEVTIATKVWTEDAAKGRQQADYALGLYGTVDIYQVHNLVNVPAQLGLLESLKAEGRVQAVGATHYQVSAFGDLAALMRTKRLDVIQIPYNPLRRDAEKELLPLAAELGIGVLVMSPLQFGVLDGKATPQHLAELGVATWPQAILKWIASDQRVATVLTATSRLGRPTEAAAAGDPPFFDADQRELVVRICAGE